MPREGVASSSAENICNQNFDLLFASDGHCSGTAVSRMSRRRNDLQVLFRESFSKIKTGFGEMPYLYLVF